MPADQPTVAVFAPLSMLTITVERRGTDDDIHLHAGGQGFWVARMLVELGAHVVLCGCFGGETGTVIRSLAAQAGVAIAGIDVDVGNAAYVHDRRAGDRRSVAEMHASALGRHEIDELYGAMLLSGLDASVSVLAGSSDAVVPTEMYARLAHDLTANGATVVADLSGLQLRAALRGGLRVVKVSHTELVDGGWARDDTVPELAVAMRTVREAGAGAVLVSRAEAPALLVDDDGEFQVSTPSLEPVDHHGAGDSMTAGVAAGLALGLPFGDAVRLGAAAGSLNVTRRGLATGERGAIERLAELVELVPVDGVDPPAPRRTTPDDLAAQVDASLRGG